MNRVAKQIADELHHALAKPALAMLGVDLGTEVARRCRAVAPHLADQLAQETDDRLAAETTVDLMCVLWPHGAPEGVGRAGWWRTPLGRLCARSLGREGAEAVTQSVAAAMLGVHPGTISQLVHRGTLDRHPDGGVLRSSVLMRLARLHGTDDHRWVESPTGPSSAGSGE